ncbi:type IV pilus twitching motility protein PilT [Geopsychrobacter electrodiphilus]|uniref:type IV pilus twitching motility protein PilT n=1 Tax=Geopsychrobacter electrodiphilus TaxID=225196 RepID=UPI00037201AE|nr:type IV pilus twitching motility protein PilT [Geopsychrobacter electrodiphilus]
MNLNDILELALKSNTSDIHLKAGLPPVFRIDGNLRPLPKAPRLTADEIRVMCEGIMNERQRVRFEDCHEVDLAYGVPGLGRFRVNVFSQRSSVSAVFRAIPYKVLTLDELHLPKVIKKIVSEQRGLVLVTGATGTGKSTTLAAMLDHINSNRTEHIVTIEDPIEYLHRDRKCIINQREVGFDTDSFAVALKSAMRQDPDVILVGEMRDLETTETALAAAETGHLVLSTMHTIDAPETITRIVAMFPPHQQRQIRLQLSGVLKGVISQRLIPRSEGKGRVAAVEVMVSTARIRDLIDDREKTIHLKDAIASGHTTYGMQTFDQSLMQLVKENIITFDEALRQSSNPDDFKLKFSGISSSSDASWQDFEDAQQVIGKQEAAEAREQDGELKIERF